MAGSTNIDASQLGGSSAVCFLDAQGRIRTWNMAAARMFGCDASTVLERPCAAVINGHSASGTQVCKQDCFTIRRASSGRTDHGNIANFDMEARPKRRRPFWVNVSVLVATEPHTERRLVVHFVRDISNRKRNERFAADVLGLARRLHSSGDSGEEPPAPPLTLQELRILELIRDGYGSERIARELEIGIGTLRNHIHDLNRKLGTHSRLEALMQAVKRGLV